jgi:hypothetical protein
MSSVKTALTTITISTEMRVTKMRGTALSREKVDEMNLELRKTQLSEI